MRLIDVYEKLNTLKQPFVRTQDVAVLFQIKLSHASKLLTRLVDSGQMVHIISGLWGFKDKIEPLMIPNYVTAPFPSYLSLQTALYYHNMIDQIPSVIYAVSLARTKVIQTPIGVISIHHIAPDFFCGYQQVKETGIQLATPEKAIVDYFYFRAAKSKLFRSLPELELPSHFDIKLARSYIEKIHSKSRRTLVSQLLEQLFNIDHCE